MRVEDCCAYNFRNPKIQSLRRKEAQELHLRINTRSNFLTTPSSIAPNNLTAHPYYFRFIILITKHQNAHFSNYTKFTFVLRLRIQSGRPDNSRMETKCVEIQRRIDIGDKFLKKFFNIPIFTSNYGSLRTPNILNVFLAATRLTNFLPEASYVRGEQDSLRFHVNFSKILVFLSPGLSRFN